MHRTRLILLLFVVGTATGIAAGAAAADPFSSGTSWYVAPDGSDSNSCTVASQSCATPQAAIAKSAAGDTIKISVGTYVGSASVVVTVDKDVTIEGGWSQSFATRVGHSVIDGQGVRPGVMVSSGVTARIERLLIENGARGLNPVAAGGLVNLGVLELDESVVRGNSDGGILNVASLVVNRSTVSGNTSNLSSLGGGITSSWMGNPTTVVVNSTITGNTAGEGGGILVGRPMFGSATVSLSNVTITGNDARYGGGGGVLLDGPTTLRLQNSIVARNTAYFSYAADVDRRGGSVVSDGFNLLGSLVAGYGSFTPGPGDRFFVDPLLGPLQANGGPTATQALLPGSPGIDAGNPAGCTDRSAAPLTTDQRGASRPFGAACDIGAYEFGAAVDAAPPVITVPVEVVVDATTPAGAPVTFDTSAVDDVDGPVATSCLPRSGSTFPIGTTTVTCTATDGAGNTASSSFPLRVRGAGEQLARLAERAARLRPGASLADKLAEAGTAFLAGDGATACGALGGFLNQVAAQAGKHLSAADAAELTAAATRIRHVIGC